MQYKELKEMTLKEWDWMPFEAFCTDNPDNIIDGKTTEILGYVQGKWFDGARWNHVYPVEWNKEKVAEALNPKPKRMTKRQLAMWLAKGNGQLHVCDNGYFYSYYDYPSSEEDNQVDKSFKVRKWDSEEWIEPTVDLLEGS